MKMLKFLVILYQSIILTELAFGKVVPVSQNVKHETTFDLENTELSCDTATDEIYSFTIPSESPSGTINLLLIQHDANRKIPVTSTALHNALNQEQIVDRVDHFRLHPCPSLTGKQTSCSQSYVMTPEQQEFSNKTSFDRGHLTPVNPMRFSESAADATYYCVNIAPQEPYTNQVPWVTVEEAVFSKLATEPGYVMTGLCDKDSSDGTTLSGYSVPDCFWKLVCYKDASNVTRVVGFIAENALIPLGDKDAQAERRESTVAPRSQFEILDRMDKLELIEAAWHGAQAHLLQNRNEERAPVPSDCVKSLIVPEHVLEEWRVAMPNYVDSNLDLSA